jgi:hypothetical protein
LLSISLRPQAGLSLAEVVVMAADQRGLPRVVDGRGNGLRSDIGAYEHQELDSADFDSDGDVDGIDFLAWQIGFGTANAVKSDGDADNDLDADGNDLSIWQNQFGQLAPSATLSASSTSNSDAVDASLDSSLVDAAHAIRLLGAENSADYSLMPGETELEVSPVQLVSQEPVEWLTSSRERDPTIVSTTGSDDESSTEASWLSDELLDSVFG